MPAATTQQRREAIDRATREARKRAIGRREARVEVTEQAFEWLAESIQGWLGQNANEDGRVPPEALGAFEAFVAALLRRAQEQWSQAVGEGIAEAASIGARWLQGEGVVARAATYFADYVGADGLQLSDRIWRVGEHTRKTVADTVRNAILRGATAHQAALELLRNGETVPAELALPVKQARDAVLGGKVTEDLLRGEGNPLRNALRVLRTEINRAFTESFVVAAFEHPDVAAVKFNLSPLHPRPDICDYFAHVNLHGLGPGVYPKGRHPYPAHPETLSFLTVVFHDEITDADRAGKQSAFGWLRTQPAGMQDAVLGKNKGSTFRDGAMLESEFTASWKQVRARLEGNP